MHERLKIFVHLSIIPPLPVARVCGMEPRNWEQMHKPRSERHSSSETQGQLAGARGNKSSKATKRLRFTSQAKKAPGNRLLPDRFQTALPMLPSDWAEKSFVLFCPIGEQQLLRYCGVFLHKDFRIAILVWFVHKHSVFEGNVHFYFPRLRAEFEYLSFGRILQYGPLP